MSEISRLKKTVNCIIHAYRDEGYISYAAHERPRTMTGVQDMNIPYAFRTATEVGAAAVVPAKVSAIERRLAKRQLNSHVVAQKPRLCEANKAHPSNIDEATEAAEFPI
ncbi:hypothetical protein HPB52_021253 [Rhipicephalus sanguineus]|uniref:Uncharacterized protein n=1 Tax=Rhipicephalus sanguineus TaxID=34632 RepID=A0A9D4Q371_RHISA|nr:hypothetical protein HPB52_021253 [Rhipicephalus sanguineus]